MKKYILLISLFCFAILQAGATIPKDTVINKRGVKIRIPDVDVEKLKNFDFNFDFEFDSSQMAELRKSFKFDKEQILAMKENLRENLKNLPSMKDLNPDNFNFNEYKGGKQARTPTRVEKKLFTDVSEVRFSHKYGNIIIQESNVKQVDLEIQYFDKGNIKGSCTVNTAGKTLSVATNKSGGGATINYIISLPKNTAVDINLTYGTVKVGRHEGAFKADLSYSDLSAQAFSRSKAIFNIKYGDLKIDEAEDLSVSGSYSDVKIKKARNMDVKGMYTDYRVDDVVSFSTSGSPAYGDIRLGTVSSVNLDTKYSDINIYNLVSDMAVKTSYGDVKVKGVSSKLKSITVNAMYADVEVSIPVGMSVTFDTDLTYGDLGISKKHSVKYTENRETNTKSVKTGQIGSGRAAATIKVKNMYADVQIK